MERRLVAIALLFFVCIAAPALTFAVTYGNLARKHGAGRIEVGVVASQTSGDFDASLIVHSSEGNATITDSGSLDIARQSVVLRYGISDASAIGVLTGNAEYKDEGDNKLAGQEVGGMFWNQFSSGASGFEGGMLIGYRTGSVSNRYWTGDTKQLDLAFGGAKVLSDQSSLFFNLVYSKLDMTLDAKGPYKKLLEDELSAEFGFPVTVSKFGQNISRSQPLILAIGAEITPSPNIALTIEVHAVAETGFALGLVAGF